MKNKWVVCLIAIFLVYTFVNIWVLCIKNPPQENPPLKEKIIMLNIRRFKKDGNKGIFDAGWQLRHEHTVRQLDVDKIALILIDVWEFYDDGMQERTQKNINFKLVPLLELARKHNIIIIHASHEGEINKKCNPLPGEFVIGSVGSSIDGTSRIRLNRYLDTHNITTLLYAGYYADGCLIKRQTGIIPMHELGYEIILVRDCTIAQETNDTLKRESIKEKVVDEIERFFGSTTTLKDLQEAFREY